MGTHNERISKQLQGKAISSDTLQRARQVPCRLICPLIGHSSVRFERKISDKEETSLDITMQNPKSLHGTVKMCHVRAASSVIMGRPTQNRMTRHRSARLCFTSVCTPMMQSGVKLRAVAESLLLKRIRSEIRTWSQPTRQPLGTSPQQGVTDSG